MIEDTRLTQFYLRLTKRQRDVLHLVSEGLTNHQAAAKLVIQPCVVASHLTNIYEELSTLDDLPETRPNRYLVIRLFSPFFERHPELRQDGQRM